MRVNLKDVIEAIAEADEEVEYYYYIPEERIISRVSGTFTDEAFAEEEPDDDDLIALPDRYEIDEYGIMKDFAETYPESSTREWLVNSIHGKGAFRRFRAVLERFYITDKWYAFQDEAYRTKAMKWCEDYGIYYASAGDYYQCAASAFDQAATLLKGGHIARPMKYINNALLALILAVLINYLALCLQSMKRSSGRESMVAGSVNAPKVSGVHWNTLQSVSAFSFVALCTVLARFMIRAMLEAGFSGGGGGGSSSSGGSSGGPSGSGGSHRF